MSTKINISTANKTKKTKFHLPTTTLTTANVAQIIPINILPAIPGDVFNVNLAEVSQSQPTVVKTFGAFHLKMFATFVPHKSVWREFENYMARDVDASLDVSPLTFSWLDLMGLLFGLNFQGDSAVSVVGSTTDFATLSSSHSQFDDFSFVTNGTTSISFNLTAKGRALYKILVGLGYEIPHLVVLPSDPVQLASAPLYLKLYDALPLLSFGRFFYDWVFPSQYVTLQGFGYLFEYSGAGQTVRVWLRDLLNLFFVPMEQDFWTSLWLYPNSRGLSSNGLSSVSEVNVFSPVSNALDGQSNVDTVRVQQSSSSNVTTFSSYALRWLEGISDYVIRNNIGGTRFHEWMKAHFGYVTNEQDSQRSQFLKMWTDSLRFSPVTSSVESGNYLLGDRVTQGNAQGQYKLKYEAKEHGFLIFGYMVVPSTDYYQGEKPWVRALGNPFDSFYVPELDSVGLEPIPRSAVYSSYDIRDVPSGGNPNSVAPLSQFNGVFGFAPKYAQKYKVGYSYLNGDFRLPSRNVAAGAYHTFRNVLYGRTNLALDAQFMQADNQYDRVFAFNPLNQDENYDKIESLFLFDVTKYSNMLSIGDSMPIFNKSGRDVTIDNGGANI